MLRKGVSMSKHEKNAIKARTYDFWDNSDVHKEKAYMGVDLVLRPLLTVSGIDISNHQADAFRYWIDCLSSVQLDFPEPKYPKTCTCGTKTVHGNVPLSSHAHYCDLRN
jgi:hypothetical protein